MSVASDLEQAYAARRAESARYYERARRVLAGGVGHDLRHFSPVPLYIRRAKAGRKWDVDGNEYVDFLLGNGALLLGHADDEVRAAVERSLADGTHFGSDHPLHIEWAEWVQRLVPCAERVRFVNSGTEATALAMRLARAWTSRPKVLRLEGHFHGWHDDVVQGFQLPFDQAGSLGVEPQRGNMASVPDGDLALVERALSQDAGISSVIVEASGASWGRVPMADDYLRGLRELTTRYKALLIFDEVVSGFRFSPGGVQQLTGVIPDMACLAKVMAGGFSGGAVVGRAEIMSLFDFTGDAQHDRFRRVVHLGTFNAAPPSAAAGISVLSRVATGGPTQAASELAATLREAFNQVLRRLDVAGYVYGPASSFHVYFETDPIRARAADNQQALHTSDARRLKGMPGNLITQYQRHLRQRGVDLMSSTGGLLSSSHTADDLAHATSAFEDTVQALLDEGLVLRIG